MNKQLLFAGFVCTSLCSWQAAQARDVQLRPNNTLTGSVSPASASPASGNSTQNLTTEQRITRLERILNSQGLEDILSRMDSLQTQIEKLRGNIEVQAHQLEEIKQRQRDLYVDIDRRLVRLERNGPGTDTGAAAAAVTPTTKPTPQAAGTRAKPVPVEQDTGSDAAGEQQAYQKAFDTLRDLRYEQAVKSFKAFLGKYPKGRYAHIAQYWIGEADYAQRKYKQAITEYQKLIDNYPTSPKLAEAMLKIGYSQYELKNNKAAETILKQLIKSYPGTTEAGQAQNLLQKIRLKK